MKEKVDIKKISGTFRKITRDAQGMFAIETLIMDKGKIMDHYADDPNYPTITLSMFGKHAFHEAQEQFDKDSQKA